MNIIFVKAQHNFPFICNGVPDGTAFKVKKVLPDYEDDGSSGEAYLDLEYVEDDKEGIPGWMWVRRCIFPRLRPWRHI